jgi:cbb3-type cytochrome oxidase subunit 3
VKLSDIVGGSGLAWYAEVALVLFFLAFLLVVWRVFKPSLKAKYDRAARMPLDDEHPQTPRSDGARNGHE